MLTITTRAAAASPDPSAPPTLADAAHGNGHSTVRRARVHRVRWGGGGKWGKHLDDLYARMHPQMTAGSCVAARPLPLADYCGCTTRERMTHPDGCRPEPFLEPFLSRSQAGPEPQPPPIRNHFTHPPNNFTHPPIIFTQPFYPPTHFTHPRRRPQHPQPSASRACRKPEKG